MSIVSLGFSAFGKLLVVFALSVAFLLGLLGVVILSLRGEEVQVPEIVGKNREEAEKELAALGLKMKKQKDRYSEEKPNTILEQSPKAGTPAKTGQMILVVVSQVNPESSEAPAVVEKETEEDNSNVEPDAERTKKPGNNKNANVKKPAQTTRDVSSNKALKLPSSNTKVAANTSKSNTSPANTNRGNTSANEKPAGTPASSPKPTPAKNPSLGDTRERRVPN